MMFVDASAIVAILTREPEAEALTDVLEKGQSPITSPIAIFEAALGICRKRHASVEEAGEDVREFLGVAGVRAVPITEKEAETALAAFSRYGKGRGHPAQLNLGDCFAYAIAKSYRTTLLFKGEDFDETDIPPAAPSPWREVPGYRSRAAGSDAGRRCVHAAARPDTPGGCRIWSSSW